MEKSPGQREEERIVPIRYRAEIYAKREGEEEVRLDRSARGSSIGGLAKDLVAQASELEAEAQDKLARAETERGKRSKQSTRQSYPVAVAVLGSEAVAVVKVGAHYSHQLSAFWNYHLVPPPRSMRSGFAQWRVITGSEATRYPGIAHLVRGHANRETSVALQHC